MVIQKTWSNVDVANNAIPTENQPATSWNFQAPVKGLTNRANSTSNMQTVQLIIIFVSFRRTVYCLLH